MKPHTDAAIVWGGKGQAKVVHQILKSLNIDLVCICDRNPMISSPVPGVPIWHTETDFLTWLGSMERDRLCFVAALGGGRGASRLAVDAYLSAMGIKPVTLTHPSAWVDSTATLGSGDQVLAMAAVGVDVSLGKQCIVNTNASIDHDTKVGDGVHVMPGATIAGQVVVEDEAVIGTSATVLPDLRIGSGAFVGAGAVVTHDVAPGTTVVGVPARPVESRNWHADSDRNPWLALEVGRHE
ncbi:MAG: acetyltransferase [Acidimicrobiales bacterium]|jgi:sugar O-acyltransferase (sialic acid O-acetyltransferase NeuD family)